MKKGSRVRISEEGKRNCIFLAAYKDIATGRRSEGLGTVVGQSQDGTCLIVKPDNAKTKVTITIRFLEEV